MNQDHRVLNLKFSKPDPRTKKFSLIMHHEDTSQLRTEADLSIPGQSWVNGIMQPIRDQGARGACTGFASTGVGEFLVAKYIKPAMRYSEGFQYDIELLMDGNWGKDAGSSLLTAADRAKNVGFCLQALSPYSDTGPFKKPTPAMYADAKKHQMGDYYALDGLFELQKCISNGYMATAGIIVPRQLMMEGFNGILPLLSGSDVLIEDGEPAGHAVAPCGYKVIEGRLMIKFRNSWTSQFGDHGYFWMDARNVADPNWVSDVYTYRLAHQALWSDKVAA